MPNKMPPLDKKLMKKLKDAWKDGLTKGHKDPEKYMYELREKMDKTKPYKGFEKSEKKDEKKTKKKTKKKADVEMAERLVARYESED
jgi:hypothetical protein